MSWPTYLLLMASCFAAGFGCGWMIGYMDGEDA